MAALVSYILEKVLDEEYNDKDSWNKSAQTVKPSHLE